MRVKVGGKAIIASFLKIEGRGRSLGRKTGERGIDKKSVDGQNPGPVAPLRCKKSAREGGAKEMSGEERLPEEQWRRMGVSRSLRGRRSEGMTQSNISSPRGSEVPLESQRE